MKVAIVGGGAAGVAAAWAARRAGADVTVLFDRAGATALYSGALDLVPWESAPPSAAIEPDLLAFAASFDAWSVRPTASWLATPDGVVRPARGMDTALLDLAPLGGRAVAVADVPVDGWHGAALARSLAASPWARRTGTRFEAVRVDGFVDGALRHTAWSDIAARCDSTDEVDRLAASLRRAQSTADAWLFGPWLGASPGAAGRLSSAVGKPCGETLSPPGGAAGARFEASRGSLLSSLGVQVRRERVDSVERRASRWHVMGSVQGALTAKDAGFDAVVLAVGGLVAGGIELDGSAFRLSLRAPARLGLDGRGLDSAASGHGVDFGALGMSALERVGILADGVAVRGGAERLFVAGDVVEGRPRTALEAARAGIAAARKALG